MGHIVHARLDSRVQEDAGERSHEGVKLRNIQCVHTQRRLESGAFGALPEGVDMYPRYGEHHTVFILVNFSKTQQVITLPATFTDVLAGGSKQSVTLPVYGVAILETGRR
jgi:beta-galactosidase GanA